MTTPKELLDAIADYVVARGDGADPATLQQLVVRFDVVLGEAVGDRASVQSEA